MEITVPTYQYACTACDERLEAVQAFADAALTECPVCGGRLRKVFSAVGVVFKGSGFYKNDSRDSANKGSKSESAPATASKEGSTGSTDSGSGSGSKDGASSSASSGGSSSSGDGGSSAPATPAKAPAATAAKSS
jgi:putative FmdB family regulatory protein